MRRRVLDGAEVIGEPAAGQSGPASGDLGGVVLSWIWLGIVLISVLWAALVSGEMAAVTASVTDGARSAVTLVIGLVGIMVFFLGLTRIAFDGGLRDAFARALAPLTRRLFPDVPPDHPAMSAMIMNMASFKLCIFPNSYNK